MELPASNQQDTVLKVLGLLNEASMPRGARFKGRLQATADRWATKLLIGTIALFCSLLAVAGVHRLLPLPKIDLSVALGLAIAVQLLSAAMLLLNAVSAIAGLVTHFRQAKAIRAATLWIDFEIAHRLAEFSLEVREAIDCWLQQEVKRMERRQVRFFGGPDKLAAVVVLGAGWALWKELGPTLTSWQASPVLFGVAALLGLVIGGIATSAEVDRLIYQRALLRLAKAVAPFSRRAQEPPLPDEVIAAINQSADRAPLLQ